MTLYVTFAVAVFPALSVAVQVTVFVPTVFVDKAPQLWLATPEPVSVAPALAVAVPLRKTGLGDTLGDSVGAVLSILIGPKPTVAELLLLSIAVPVALNVPSVLKT
jgi:hypothetical protein